MNVTHPTLSQRPIMPSKMPKIYDHARRFIARYALQALLDYYWPTKEVSLADWLTAQEFVTSRDGQFIFRSLGIPVNKIIRTLPGVN